MKISQDNLKMLQGFVSEYLTPDVQEQYAKQGLSTDRFLFDSTYHGAECAVFIANKLCRDEGLKNEHIRSALRHIARKNGCKV